LAEFVRVQKEQNERISELRSALAAEQQKSSTTEAFVKENAHKFADMYNEIGDLRRAEASAYAEIAQLKERVETEKTFYAYHMADAERSKKRVHDLEELNTGYLGEIAGLEDANREADALLGQCSDQIGVAVAEARRWKTACLVVSFVLVVVLLIPLVVSA
jgi:chromosome segregation ATPase